MVAATAKKQANRNQSVSSRPPSTRARRAWTLDSLRGSIRGRRRYDINVYAGELEVRPPGTPTTGGPDSAAPPPVTVREQSFRIAPGRRRFGFLGTRPHR